VESRVVDQDAHVPEFGDVATAASTDSSSATSQATGSVRAPDIPAAVRPPCFVHVAVQQRQRRPLGGEGASDGSAEAASSAGDDGDLTREPAGLGHG